MAQITQIQVATQMTQMKQILTAFSTQSSLRFAIAGFGGDVSDRGKQSIRVTRCLAAPSIREAQPSPRRLPERQ